jgi:transposase InsO family protein
MSVSAVARRCNDGTPLRVTHALDGYNREAISWAATTGGHGDVWRAT